MDIIGSLVYSFGWNLKKINMMSIEDKPEWAIILMCMVIKHCCRRLFGLLSSLHSKELSDRVMFLSEHVIFSFWAYHCVYYVPEMENPGSSWLFNTPLLWVGADSPSPALLIFYFGKVGTHFEDLLYIIVSLLFPGKDGSGHSDLKMVIHHVATALLCLSSWFSGYLRIGSVIMLLHDVSDVPLDLVRVTGALKMKNLQIVSMVLTLLAWGYWRLYFLPFEINRSVIFESSYSHLDAASDPSGDLYLLKVRMYASLIGSLCILHYLWFWMMLQKSYRELFGGEEKKKKKV